jgi:tetratricopeptide (TPR) repeat protein
MSPEQALAKRVVIDHRTDVYSLGATLYELLTLRPAFTGADRQELLRQIAFEEPVKPRRLEKAVPAELETIVLKALEKNPADRYATAQELADDLQRWLDDKPIRARRPSLRQVAGRWARRHRAAVWTAAAVLLVAAVLGGGAWLSWERRRIGAEAEGRAALGEANRLLQQERWPEALSAARRAAGVLAGVGADADLRRQVEELSKDLEMAQRLQEARLQGTAVKDGHFDGEAACAAYAEAFRWYGLEAGSLDPQEAGERIRARPIQRQLVVALDHWAVAERATVGQGWAWLAAVARAADPDEWRDRLRDAWQRLDSKAVDELLTCAPPDGWLLFLGVTPGLRPREEGAANERALSLLRQAQERHPDDFWANHNLAYHLYRSRPPRLEESIRYFMVAVALRPQSPRARLNLGVALEHRGDLDGAITQFREAIQLRADYAEAHASLSNALRKKGCIDEAVAECREALRLKPDDPIAHIILGTALKEKGRLDEAIAEYREGLRLKDYPEAHYDLGIALYYKGDLDGAITEYREALRLKPDYPEAHTNLGLALASKGDLDGSIAEYQRALRLNKDLSEAHSNLGNALKEKSRLEEAIAECREALRLKPDSPDAYFSLGTALRAKGLLDEAITEYREALRLRQKFPEAHNNLGLALKDKGLLDEAITELRKALRLKPDYPQAHNNLGLALARKGLLDEAITEYREALQLKNDYPGHINLGAALADKGRLDEAMAEYQEALRLKPDSSEAHTNLGNALKDKGRLDEAIREYRKAIRLNKDLPEAHCNLGNALVRKGDLDEAIAEYRKATRLKPDYAEAHYNLGIALKNGGKPDEAITEYREAIRIKGDIPEAHCNLGNILLDRGQFKDAVEALRRGHELGSRKPGWRYPSAQWLRRAEQIAKLDERLSAVLAGNAQPKDASERLVFAQLGQEHRKRFAAAARFYEESFAAQPALAENLASGHRYNAARAAALAGCGQGQDAAGLADEERTRLRQQALDWLRADLGAWRRLLEKEPDKARPVVAKKMQRWLEDTDFVGVRGPEALAKLPEAERQDWQKLWQAVEALHTRAAERPKATSSARP